MGQVTQQTPQVVEVRMGPGIRALLWIAAIVGAIYLVYRYDKAQTERREQAFREKINPILQRAGRPPL